MILKVIVMARRRASANEFAIVNAETNERVATVFCADESLVRTFAAGPELLEALERIVDLYSAFEVGEVSFSDAMERAANLVDRTKGDAAPTSIPSQSHKPQRLTADESTSIGEFRRREQR